MISVTILTKNSDKTLGETLGALSLFPEVVVYDTGSEDKTVAIASSFPNVQLFEGPFIGFGATHNKAAEKAKYDWILSIDSDEVVSQSLAQAILQERLDEGSVYALSRHNFFNGKEIRWCGWYPDPVIRLYNRKATQFVPNQVHERVASEGLCQVQLTGPLYHTPYLSIDDFLRKMQHYSTLFAEERRGKCKSSLFKAIYRGLFAFFKSYILKRGFLGGFEGFVISFYNGETTYYKYLKLRQANREEGGDAPKKRVNEELL